nr:endothelin-converting enzyme homolog [Drosophila takahashii]
MPFLFIKLYMAENFKAEIMSEVSEIEGEVYKSIRRSLGKYFTHHHHLSIPIRYLFDRTQFNILADRLIPEISRLEIDDHSYAATNINLKRLGADVNRYSTLHSDELSVQLSESPNTVLLHVLQMATLLQAPFYNQSWPFSLKFGALGGFVARTFSNLHWTLNLQFLEKFDCFWDNYGSLHDLNSAESEIGNYSHDFDRLRLAFSAYQSHMKQLLEDPKQERINEQMPGLDMSPEQLFILGSIQTLCSDYEDHHAYIAMALLTRNEEFFQAFNCSAGSGMRSQPKLVICGNET